MILLSEYDYAIKMQNLKFFAMTDVVLVGHNPENADYDNPKGEIYGYAAYVVAEDEDGNRLRKHIHTSWNEKPAMMKAETFVAAYKKMHEEGRVKIDFNKWDETFPAYGSNAYKNNQEENLQWERMIDEQDEYR